MRRLDENALRNIVLGAGLLGAGGGGSTREGMKLVDRVLEFSDGVDLITPQEVSDDDWGAVIAGMGSPIASLTRVRTWSPLWALESLEKELGFKSSFVIPFELGAGNSLNPMLAAVQRKIPMIDGDPCGRAVPQVDMTTFFLGGMPISPFALSTEDEINVVIRTKTPADIERIARAITAEIDGVSATSCHAMNGKDLKRLIISGTTSLVEEIGALIQLARAKGKDPSDDLVAKYNGYLLGRGVVEEVKVETKGGFDLGEVRVAGDLPVTITFQNENMTAHNGDQLVAVVPDLICAISDQGEPLTNADIEKGTKLSYIGFKAPVELRSEAMFGMFKPILSALGYNGNFIPIESLH